MSIVNLSVEKDSRYIYFYRENINILVYVANEVEFRTTISFLEKNNANVVSFINDNKLYYIAKIGLYPVAIVKGGTIGQTQIGSCDPIINSALKTFNNIKYLITVGVCGAASKKVNIGDVIIANEIIDYESQKIQDDYIIDRSQSLCLSTLCNIVASKIGLMHFEAFDVHFGKIMSGNKLVNSRSFSEELNRLHEEAIALDMEGYTVSRIAMSNKLIDWLFIKSASDRLYDKQGSMGQERCMNNALKVLMQLFSQPNIFESSKIKVMISGSYVFGDPITNQVEELSYKLTQKLINLNYKIISGYGKCVGNAVVAGAYNAQNRLAHQESSIQDYIEIYPFPRVENKSIVNCLDNIKYENRQLMIKGCSFCIFIYGKKDTGELASGMDDEFRLSNKAFPIPVGATGYKAKELWEMVHQNLNLYYPISKELQDSFNRINISIDIDQIVNEVVNLISLIKNSYFEYSDI